MTTIGTVWKTVKGAQDLPTDDAAMDEGVKSFCRHTQVEGWTCGPKAEP